MQLDQEYLPSNTCFHAIHLHKIRGMLMEPMTANPYNALLTSAFNLSNFLVSSQSWIVPLVKSFHPTS